MMLGLFGTERSGAVGAPSPTAQESMAAMAVCVPEGFRHALAAEVGKLGEVRSHSRLSVARASYFEQPVGCLAASSPKPHALREALLELSLVLHRTSPGSVSLKLVGG